MIILFKGPARNKLIYELNENESCLPILEKSNLYKDSKDLDHFEKVILPKKLDKLELLVNDVEVYVKKNLWFYGNMICTICNP